MFGHTDDDNFDENATITDNNSDGVDIDKLLDDIKFEDENDAAILAPLSDDNVQINTSEDDLSLSLPPPFDNTDTDLPTDETADTPSFLNDWEELPKDDGNGIWKADTPFMEDDGMGADDNLGLDDNNIVISIPHETDDDTETSNNSQTQDTQPQESTAETEETTVADLATKSQPLETSFKPDNSETAALQTVETATADTSAPTPPETPADEPVMQPILPNEPALSPKTNDAGYAVWYSGDPEDKYFEISRQSETQLIEGTPECNAIHVNSGLDSYGWLVSFGNNVTMSLADVREYQLRNGTLPYTDGIITYGVSEFTFRDIERIVVYQSVRYFSYGLN